MNPPLPSTNGKGAPVTIRGRHVLLRPAIEADYPVMYSWRVDATPPFFDTARAPSPNDLCLYSYKGMADHGDWTGPGGPAVQYYGDQYALPCHEMDGSQGSSFFGEYQFHARWYMHREGGDEGDPPLVHDDPQGPHYGVCNPGDGGCEVPLNIRIEPACYLQPEMIANEAKEGQSFTVRNGAESLRVAGAQLVWIGDVLVTINGWPPERVSAAAESLVSVNVAGPSSPNEELPAPNRDCSEFRMEPHPALEE